MAGPVPRITGPAVAVGDSILYALCYIAGLLSGAGLAAIFVPPLVSRHWKEVLMHAISEMIPTAVEQYDEGYSQAFNDYREPGEN